MAPTPSPLVRLSAANPIADEDIAAAVTANWREDLLARILREPAQLGGRAPGADVVHRRGAGRGRIRAAVALVGVLLAIGGAAALAAPTARKPLADLGAWLRDIPGDRSRNGQERFDRQNALAYGHFPQGTRVGVLLRRTVGGQPFELLGFRAGERLCLRLETPALPAAARPPECVSLWELSRTDEPAAVLAAHLLARLSDGSARPVVYGLVADDVEHMEVGVASASGQAAIAHNAFLYVGSPVEAIGPAFRSITGVAVGESGRRHEIRVASSPLPVKAGGAARLPGPDRVERKLEDGRIGWLDRGEARGEEFAWPGQRAVRVLWARSIQPDSASPFRIAISRAERVGGTHVAAFYCLKWLWPLLATTGSTSCIRTTAVASGIAYTADLPNSGEQFPFWVGLAADEITRLELFYPDGQSRGVAVVDNTFAFQTRRGEPVKLAAYDRAGRVVKVGLVGSAESGLSGLGMSP
jgi:hypothetical protein